MQIPRVVEVFSGAGGFSLGFHAAGCLIQAAVDVDEAAVRSFHENFSRLQPGQPPMVFPEDLEDFNLDRVTAHGRPDILIGGPPCQGFSRVGRGKLDSLTDEGFIGDPRNDLYRLFLHAVKLWRPAAVVMENVPGMLSVAGRNVADEAAGELASLGYRVGYAVLNAVWYGVPQYRERLFFIATRDDLDVMPVMPTGTHLAILPPGYLRPSSQLAFPFVRYGSCPIDLTAATVPATTVGEALDDLPVLSDHLNGDDARPPGDFRRALSYGSSPHSEYARLMRGWPGLPGRETLDDHVIRRTPRDYETFARMKHGDRYPAALAIARQRFIEALEQLASRGERPDQASPQYEELRRRFVPPYPEEVFIEKWRKLIPDQPSWTVPAHLSKDAYSHIHHDSMQKRAISVREAARLQSFPDGFTFSGNMGDCFRQIGNAVPPLLAWAVACTVLQLLGLVPRCPFSRRGERGEVGLSAKIRPHALLASSY